MSLGKIIVLSMALGVVCGFLAAPLLPGDGPAAGVGVAVSFFSVIAAGLRQPVPPRRPRR